MARCFEHLQFKVSRLNSILLDNSVFADALDSVLFLKASELCPVYLSKRALTENVSDEEV